MNITDDKRMLGRLPWFMEAHDEESRGQQLQAVVDNLEQYQYNRAEELLRWGSIYHNQDLLSMCTPNFEARPNFPTQILNVTQAVVDTVVSKHAEAETKATFQTEDGNFMDHQRAEQLDKFVFGESYRLDLDYKKELCFRDACVDGDGYLKFASMNGKVTAERILPIEIMYDEAACMGNRPTEMYHRRYVSRSWAIEHAGEFLGPGASEEKISELQYKIMDLPNEMPAYFWPGCDTDMVKLVEAWHLPSNEAKDNGRHIIVCGNVLLNPDDTSWDYECFPFARISWSPARMGAYSTSLVKQLAPLQMELNKMMRRIQHSLHLMSVPRIWQSSSTKVSPEYDNLIGNVYKFSGPKPEIDTAPSVNPELYAQADRIRERMYEQARQNPMQNGDMPSRFDSKPALREATEIADQPHAWVGKNWQRFSMECAKQIIRCAREIVAERGSYEAFGRAKDFVEKIDFAECDMEDNRFVMRPEATSLLPTTPTGKRIVIQDLMDHNLFTDPQEAWEMLGGMPDVDAVISRKTAGRRLTEKQIYSIVKKQKYVGPDQAQDAIYAKKFAQEELQMLLMKDDVPQVVIDMLDQYIEDCDTLDQMANPPPPPPDPNAAPPAGPLGPPPPPGAPMGGTLPPPGNAPQLGAPAGPPPQQ
ncbi:hypothetical protein Q3G72_022658 [Acer saccharum]|nr:hypothetical protein Q3G72_022658 [Acer saccharum]